MVDSVTFEPYLSVGRAAIVDPGVDAADIASGVKSTAWHHIANVSLEYYNMRRQKSNAGVQVQTPYVLIDYTGEKCARNINFDLSLGDPGHLPVLEVVFQPSNGDATYTLSNDTYAKCPVIICNRLPENLLWCYTVYRKENFICIRPSVGRSNDYAKSATAGCSRVEGVYGTVFDRYYDLA